MKGQIFRIIAGFYDIKSKNKIYRVRGSGNLRNKKETPLVGDFVDFNPNRFLLKIFSRKNKLIRPKVANIDQVIIVISLKNPKYSSLLLNKFLAVIEFQNIIPIIVFTKTDLTNKSYSKNYLDDGYIVFEINNFKKSSLINLKKIFDNKLSVFTGQTGVGKSTTIENITGIKRETQSISKSLGRGKHTTRIVEILDWEGKMIIDTPGFSSFDVKISKQELAKSYQDFRINSIECKFKDCLHKFEKKCKIKELVEENKISNTRYMDYLRILKEL